MNIHTNEPLLKRNRIIGQVYMFGGMAILIGGLIISMRMPEQTGLSFGALILGFFLSQFGFYFMNRWGRRPRPDELLNQALKGLDSSYSIYHYTTPAEHLLVGPAGIWILSPRYQVGTITFARGQWRQKGGNLYMKIFGQQGIGRPDLELSYEVERIQKFLQKNSTEPVPLIQAALIFVNEKANLQVDESENPPAATLSLAKLKEHIRKAARNKALSVEKAANLQELFSSKKSK